ncbi:PrsW family intramembrane metalloprotease [Rhodococcus sp. ABRD24]|uniref:PrsW family intramembrane metalloprotease n=1 Tax=Rhodococcus sp. ABRD24 TaxID=2507582 RepID=UPI00103A7DDE|nr:PrsW family intramembrane metalloprotease [Rhodococcus sp. ABRD24]QBJ95004.1 PrsW family intramembrane metalloprotease [Rhodococcus sp. ABRD24]
MSASTLEQSTAAQRRAVVYRPESAVFWVFAGALVFGVISLMALNGAAMHATLDASLALVPVWLLFIVALVSLMLRFDPFRSVRRYPQVLAAGFSLGGTITLVMAMHGNDALGRIWQSVLDPEVYARWDAALSAPLIEEASKAMAAAVVLVLCAGVMNRISHALMVGMFVGFGFDVMEDLTYSVSGALSNLDSDLAGARDGLLVRIFTAVPSHWAFTSLTAVGVLLLLPSFDNRAGWTAGRRRLVAVGLFFSAWLMHFVWNSPNPDELQLPVMAAKLLFSLTLFLTIAALLLRHERRYVQARIDQARIDSTDPVSAVAPEILDSLPTYLMRRSLRRTARRGGGRGAARAVKLQQRHALDLIQESSVTRDAVPAGP